MTVSDFGRCGVDGASPVSPSSVTNTGQRPPDPFLAFGMEIADKWLRAQYRNDGDGLWCHAALGTVESLAHVLSVELRTHGWEPPEAAGPARDRRRSKLEEAEAKATLGEYAFQALYEPKPFPEPQPYRTRRDEQ